MNNKRFKQWLWCVYCVCGT